jgi:hypothetical protein
VFKLLFRDENGLPGYLSIRFRHAPTGGHLI